MNIDRSLGMCSSQCQSEYLNTDFISNIVLETAETQLCKQTKQLYKNVSLTTTSVY